MAEASPAPTLMSRSMSASRLTMVILCMTMSTTLLSRDCHLSRAALLKLWLAPFFWNFFLETEAKGVWVGPLPNSALPQGPASARPPPQISRPGYCTSTSPGRAGAMDSGRGVVPQEMVDFAVPLVHDARD